VSHNSSTASLKKASPAVSLPGKFREAIVDWPGRDMVLPHQQHHASTKKKHAKGIFF